MSMDLAYYLRGYSLSSSAMLVYGVLEGLSRASLRNGKPYTYISRESIGKRIGKSERTARRAVKELERAGLIAVKRMGRNLNDHIFVFSPTAPQEEKQKTIETTNHSVYVSAIDRAKMSAPYDNGKKVNNTIDSTSLSIPDEIRQQTAPKGKPTPKRRRKTADERQKAKKKYKDYLIQRLKLNEMRCDIVANGDEYEALSKCVELVSNTMISNSQVYVNGCLLSPIQWWSCVKNITQETLIELIYKVSRQPDIRNWRAYMLSSIYNASVRDVLEQPYYNAY